MQEITPLSRQQQIFLQRFLASHVLTESQAQLLFEEVLQTSNEQPQHRNQLGRDLKDTLGRINRSLKPAFRLEIKSISLALLHPTQSTTNTGMNEQEFSYSSSSSTSSSVLYHAIVNCDSDEVAKTAANPTFTKNPHELAYFRLLLERFVEKEINDSNVQHDDNDNDNATSRHRRRHNGRGKGCTSYMSRMDMINLRLELTDPHKDKITIKQAENALNLLEVQGWLVPALPTLAGGTSRQLEDELDENSMTSPHSSSSSSMRRSSRRRAESGTNGGGIGMEQCSKYLQIGPRCYLEFPDFLTKVGLEKDKLPQFLLH